VLFAAEFGTGQVLWSIFWFFLFFMWIWLVIAIFADIMRSDESGVSKALWAVLIIFLPYIGVFLYLIVNGGKMGQRSVQAAQKQDDAMQSYIRNAAGSSSDADQLASLAELHSSGKIDDAEYASAKAKVING